MKKMRLRLNSGPIVAAGLTTVAAALDTYIGVTSGWPAYIYCIIWIQMGIIIYTALDERIPIKIQSIIFATMVWNTIFLSGIYMREYYLELLMLCGALLLVSFYQNILLILYEMGLVLLALLLHGLVFDSFDLWSDNSRAEFFMALFLLFGVGLVLYLNILRAESRARKLVETANRAERAEKAKSDFLANMSHEIRTPMNAIIGMCELVLREDSLEQSVRENCLQIQNSGRSLLSIINDVLDFSKIESGKMELVEDEFNLASTLNDVINMTMTRLGDKKIEFLVRVDPDIPEILIGDEMRLRQIMINLLTNAVKYTNKGVILLTVKKTFRQYGINLNVSVKDTGIGITKENLEKLFSSFQQVDTKKNRAVEGTGLGLVITKRLLSSMGGFIKVKSEYGKGTEFSFVIPLQVGKKVPFISIKNSENICAAVFIELDKFKDPSVRASYKKFLLEIGESVQIRNYVCKSFEELKLRVNHGKITHCFIGKEEYLENTEYFESIADEIRVVVVQERRNSVKIPSNMRVIYKPIYEVPIANILNFDEAFVDVQRQETSHSFIAPKARVLLVDDNPINLKVATGLMQPYQMQILTAESGQEALRMLESKDFDLVFMDHMMPVMDGVEVTKIIREMPEKYYKDLPIVALTANAIGGAREMFLQNGFQGFLAKPIELSALDRILRQHLPKELIVKEKAVLKENSDFNLEEIKIDEEIAKVIDIKTGLFYVGNSNEAYLSILEAFVQKGEEKLILLKELFEKKDWKNYVIEVHALKSSSLSLGAKELSQAAEKLELSGKADDYGYIEENHEDMIALYGKVVLSGEKILEDNLKTSDSEEKSPEGK